MNCKHVVIVGGGFAGMACAKKLIHHQNVRVTLIDKNNYHKFTPLLYQVATSNLSSGTAAFSFRQYFSGVPNIDIKMASAARIDPKTLTVHTEEGESYSGDYLVLAAGSVVNFFNTPGADKYSFPLYNLLDAERLRSRIIGAFEDADRNAEFIEQGVLNFVIVGGGPTGTEVAGAIADMLCYAMPREFNDLAFKSAKIYLVNHGKSVLEAFSKESQNYATEVLKKRGIELVMGTLVQKITEKGVELSNGKAILSKTVIWAGGLKAPSLADHCSLKQGHAGRIIVKPDLEAEGFPCIYVLGDLGVIAGLDGNPLPQLASVAKQTGKWAAKNILADIRGKPLRDFRYIDKGIMAMIGKSAAVVEVGKKRHQLKGCFAYFTWLGVHLALLSTISQKVEAIMEWIIDYFSRTPSFQLLDRRDTTRIDWTNKENER